MSDTVRLAEEKVRARRALLAHPLLRRSDDPDGFELVVKHRGALRDWFANYLGEQLLVDNATALARLYKTVDTDDPTRLQGVDPSKSSLQRRLTLLFLVAAALDERQPQALLTDLVASVSELAAADAIPDFDPTTRPGERYALRAALLWFVNRGIVTIADGDAERYPHDPNVEALLHIDGRALQRILMPLDSTADHAAAALGLLDEDDEDPSPGQDALIGQRVTRRLLEDPVVYFDDLGEEERQWVGSHWDLLYRLAADVGLVVERRAEGLAAIDDSDAPLADRAFPAAGSTVAHAALLLAERVVERRSTDDTPAAFGREELASMTDEIVTGYADACNWAKASYGLDTAGGRARLAEDAVDYLVSFGLLTDDSVLLTPRPAIARFAADTPKTRN